MTEKTSEFGKGFVYNLILFTEHFRNGYSIKGDYESWFYGVGNHLFELEIPGKWEAHDIGDKTRSVISYFNRYRLGGGTIIEYREVQRLVKDIGLLIDNELGLNPIKGDYE